MLCEMSTIMTMSSHSLLTLQEQGLSSGTSGLMVVDAPGPGVDMVVSFSVCLAILVVDVLVEDVTVELPAFVDLDVLFSVCFAIAVVDELVEGLTEVGLTVELPFTMGQKVTTKSSPVSPQQGLQ